MNKFKPGDRVRYVGNHEGRQAESSVVGNVGTVELLYPLISGEPQVSVVWDNGSLTYTLPYEYNLELVVPQYDEATKDALVAYTREQGHIVVPNAIEDAWSEITAPKTHTVVVEFEVDATFDLVAVLTDLEYAHEGIRFVDVKED